MKATLRILCAALAPVVFLAVSSEGSAIDGGTGAASTKSAGMSAANAQMIRAFTGGWGKGAGAGAKIRQREFAFKAVVAKHSGDWDSSLETADGKITGGDLPALLEFTVKESRGKIQTDYKNVQAVALDSEEIFAVKPVFIYFSGSQDFSLSEEEVANLQKYIRLGGAIWGNGQSDEFSIAFRREMMRVMPDKNKDFERINAGDPSMRKDPFFPNLKRYPEAFARRYFGELAIIYTVADFSAKTPDSSLSSLPRTKDAGDLEFGVNLIAHLLTRWEEKLRASPRE